MNAALIEKCELLMKNREILIKEFMWDSPDMALATSAIFVSLNREADEDRLKACQQILKKDSGIFSDYRGHVKLPLLSKMSMAEDPEQYFQKLTGIVDQMKELKWIEKTYKILAAMTIIDHAEPAEYEKAVSKMVELYHGMHEKHPWLTSSEDVPLAAMLAVSGMDSSALSDEMEKCYKKLTEFFHDKNAVQSLSQVLAADPKPAEEKCAKVEEIYTALKADKHKYGSGMELAVLGTLALLDLPVQTIVEEITEADEYLKKQKGFGNLTMGQGTRRMYAALMALDTHVAASTGTDRVVDVMLSIVVAMEVLMVMMMCSICVSTSAGN